MPNLILEVHDNGQNIVNKDFKEMFTLQEKYDWLCQKLKVVGEDYNNHDAFLIWKREAISFQFQGEMKPTTDEAITHAMKDDEL